MMTNAGKEYATAFFTLACEKNAKYEYDRALDTFCEVFEKEPDYIEFLSSPSVPVKERIEAIEEAFGKYVPCDALSYLQLMCEKGRIGEFLHSVKEYKELLLMSDQIIKATVKSAVELTDDEKEKLKKALEKSEGVSIEADYEIDKTLLGGVVVTLGDKVIDGSLRSRLGKLKDVMIK